MPAARTIYLTLACMILALAQPAAAATVNAIWNTATDVPVTASSYTATGSTVNFTLNFAPPTGTNLTVVNNTELPFISGAFDNLAQGQAVALSYGGVTYKFVAHYYGGTGNDLVLVWAGNRPIAWGSNDEGELGNNSTANSPWPTAVTTAGTPLASRVLLAISSGATHSVALCSDGTLASWGDNQLGQLGSNTTGGSRKPVAVTTAGTPLAGKVAVAVSAGAYQSLVLCSDGTLAAWGGNNSGELGNGFTTNSSAPVAVTTMGTPLAGKSVVAINSGADHSLALCSDGTLAAWGYNNSGELGNGLTTNSSVPVAVTTAGTPLAGRSVVSVAAGGHHNIALCVDGTLVTWGNNFNGQLGNNTTTSSSVPVAVNTTGTVLEGKTVIAVTAGGYHCLVLCSDGTLAAWGLNSLGQLGNNGTTKSSVPVAVSTSGVLAGKSVIGVTAGFDYSMAQCSDGSVVAWGNGFDGQLGNNSMTNSKIPVAVLTYTLTTGERLKLVASGASANHSLGVVATPFPAVTTLAATSVGTTMAVLNGTVNANGGTTAVSFDYGLDSSYGMNVTGTPASSTVSSATTVSTTLTGLIPNTTYHFRVNGMNGSALSNGTDLTFTTLNGNLSNLAVTSGTFSPAFSPKVYSQHAAVPAAVSSVTVTPTTSDSNATVTVNGMSVVSGSASSPVSLVYGDNTINIVVTANDNISTVTYALIVTRAAPNPLTAAYTTAGDVPITSNGLAAAGGTVNLTLNYAPVPGTILTVVNNTGIGFINGMFSNLEHGQFVNLSYNGVTYPFVANYYGGTGNDLVLVWASSRPVAWGLNTYGELGNNSTKSSNIPVAVTTAGTPLASRTLLALSAGNEYSVALFSDGTLASWGNNDGSQLGTTTLINGSSVPVPVSTGGTLAGKVVMAVSSGSSHSIVLCTDGTLAGWGDNTYGQVGYHLLGFDFSPIPVTTAGTPLAGKSVVAISAGAYHSLALCSDGTLAAWGQNFDGELGNNNIINYSSVPVAVTTAGTPLAGRSVVAVAAGGHHNIALCSDGTLVTWGWGYSGQLGNNTTTNSSVPVAVVTAETVLEGKTVIAVAAGAAHSLALCSDGTLAAWGDNSAGELGNNTYTQSNVPVAVSTSGVLAGKTVVGLTAGNSYSVARCADGTMATWGFGYYGELGNNSYVTSSIPVEVNTSALAPAESFMMVTAGSSAHHSLGLIATPVPNVTSLAATSVTATTAVLNSMVNPNDGTAAVSFDYGPNNTYGTNVAGTPAAVTGSSATAASTTLASLTPNTTYHFRAKGGTYSGGDLTFTTLSQLQNWRQQSFGTMTNTGLLADIADYDGDGISNLLEFALNLNPTAASTLLMTSALNGASFEYIYSRSTAAVTAGTAFTVEWSDTLAAGSWSGTGVTQTVLTDDGTMQQVKAVIPINAAKAKFVRLAVTAP